MFGKAWSSQEIDTLVQAWGKGVSLEDVAALLSCRSLTSVRVQVKRLHLRHTKEQTRRIMSEKMSGAGNGMFGKPSARRGVTVSEDTRERIRKAAKEGFVSGKRKWLAGSENPMFGKPSPMRGKTLPETALLVLSRKATIRWAGRSEEFRQAHLVKMRQGWSRWAISGRPTWIEKEVASWLISAEKIYVSQVVVGFYVVDFLLGKTVIETHGDYWHGNPSVYSPECLDATQKANIRRDRAKRTFLANRGYTLVEMWEKDIKADPEGGRGHLLGVLK